MHFLDEAKIYVKSGHGGAGCVSFRREANVPFGGPDGGDGGAGGGVIIRAVSGLNTLIDFRYQQHFRAQAGEGGKGRNRSGLSRDDIIIPVPVGTQILAEDKETELADLLKEGDEVTLVKGGKGGVGNTRFKSSTNQAPRQFVPGEPGEDMWIWLRLKLISDAGVVGLPNAGKSTFLAAVSRAKPKIADYPFTTLTPQLGVVYIDQKEFVLADIPGLIEGAHEGLGLGDKFLKHIERCGTLLHLVDGTLDDVAGAYRTIRHELEAYSPILLAKQEIVALNKCDALDKKDITAKKKKLKKAAGGQEIYTLSGVSGEGKEAVLRALWKNILEDREKRENATRDS